MQGEYERGDTVRIKAEHDDFARRYEMAGLDLIIKGKGDDGCYRFQNHSHIAMPRRLELVSRAKGPW